MTSILSFSPPEADRLRRAMGKQRSKEGMEKVRQRFVSGAADRGIDRATADRVIEEVAAEYKV